jgi:hypothetical protein
MNAHSIINTHSKKNSLFRLTRHGPLPYEHSSCSEGGSPMNQVSTHACACDVAASQITNYDLLPDFPGPVPFINHYTKKMVMAVKTRNDRIKFYFIGKKYWQKDNCEGIRSRIIKQTEFNERFSICTNPLLSDAENQILLERKPCSNCGISKFTIEFHHNTQKFNTRSDVCIVCTEAAKDALPPPPEDLEDMNRAIKTKFMQYMTIRPHYFTMTFNRQPTPENISKEFENLKGGYCNE